MNNYCGIIEDLDRCVGCYACRLACEQANDLDEGDSWIKVITLGPKATSGGKSTEHFVAIGDNCHMSYEKGPEGLETPCVRACIPKALKFGDAEIIIRLLKQEDKRYQICKLTEKNNAREP